MVHRWDPEGSQLQEFLSWWSQGTSCSRHAVLFNKLKSALNLLLRICMKMKVLFTQLCPSLWDPMGCSLPGSSFHGIFQARILEQVSISFFRRSSWPGGSNLCLLHWQVEPPGKPSRIITLAQIVKLDHCWGESSEPPSGPRDIFMSILGDITCKNKKSWYIRQKREA